MSNDQIQTSKTNYVQFDNDIVVDTISGMPVGASQSGFARITNAPESSVRSWVNSTSAGFSILELEIHTPTGLRRARIIPFSAFKSGFVKFNPALLEAASDYGIAAYTLNLAGYKVEQPKAPQQPQTALEYAKLYVASETRALALEAQIENDADDTNHGKMVRHSSNFRDIGAFGKTLVPVLGRNKTFKLLHELGFTMQKFPLPYQSHINNGNFEVIQVVCDNGKGGYGTF